VERGGHQSVGKISEDLGRGIKFSNTEAWIVKCVTQIKGKKIKSGFKILRIKKKKERYIAGKRENSKKYVVLGRET